MNRIIKHIIVCTAFLFIGNVSLWAQVVIGSDLKPVKAALLELKNFVAAPDTTNASAGGLVLPRVKLENRSTLEPFIRITDPEWTSNQDQTRIDHIGLMVYNLTNHQDFRRGIYIWTVFGWKSMRISADYVFLPAFKIPWQANGTVNLYDIYTSGLLGQTASPAAYRGEADDFDYVVSDYDNRIITIHGISDTGVMTYAIPEANNSLWARENTYMNVVMIRK